MDSINIIFILDDKITEINATDKSQTTPLTICGEISVDLEGISSVEDAVNNVINKFNADSINDIALNAFIINNGADKSLVAALYNKLSGANTVNIISAEKLAPIIAMNKKLELPAVISFNDVLYRVDKDGVSAQSSAEKPVSVTNDDLLFLFWVNPDLFTGDSAEFTELEKSHSALITEREQLKKELANSEEKVAELKEQVSDMEKEMKEIEESSIPFFVVDDNSFKSEVANLMENPEIVHDFSLFAQSTKSSTTVFITHTHSGMRCTFELLRGKTQSEDSFKNHVHARTAFAIKEMSKIAGVILYQMPSFSSMNVGDSFDFGRIESASIKWRVLKIEENRLLAISEKTLAKRKFDEKSSDGSWENCSLREWLNGEFYNTVFTDEEKLYIDAVSTKDGKSKIPFSNEKTDNVFILSESDVTEVYSSHKAILPSGNWIYRDSSSYARYYEDILENKLSYSMARKNFPRMYLYMQYSEEINPAIWIRF